MTCHVQNLSHFYFDIFGDQGISELLSVLGCDVSVIEEPGELANPCWRVRNVQGDDLRKEIASLCVHPDLARPLVDHALISVRGSQLESGLVNTEPPPVPRVVHTQEVTHVDVHAHNLH